MIFSKFFSNIQEAPWYRSFLNPVINQIGRGGKLLDIGTGSGKLIQILATQNNIDCVGVDTNSEMLAEAKKKLANIDAELIKIKANSKLPFENNTFDYITICNVLFHLKHEDIDKMLKDAQGLLKKEGKIIVLTPTGAGSTTKLSKHYLALNNLGIYIWFNATKTRAKIWAKDQYLKQYASKNELNYKSEIVMNGFAQLEIISVNSYQ